MLEVDGQSYIDGPCDIELYAGDGSLSIGVRTDSAPHAFAYVTTDPDANGVAVGQWNGSELESHAHNPLGYLFRY